MFWDSVVAGLAVLTYWETYVAGLEYLAIFFVPMGIVGVFMESSDSAAGYAGCLSAILLPLIQVAALAVMTLTLAPIIFGVSDDAAWAYPWRIITVAPMLFFKLIGQLVFAAILLAFVPILGRLHSLHTLVLGGISLTFLLGILDSMNPGVVAGRVDLIPSFWFSVGLIIVGGIMSWVGIFVAGVAITVLELSKEGIGQIIMVPVVAIFGFIPVFIYGAWLGAQLKGGF